MYNAIVTQIFPPENRGFKKYIQNFQAFLSYGAYTVVKAQGSGRDFKENAKKLQTFDTFPVYDRF